MWQVKVQVGLFFFFPFFFSSLPLVFLFGTLFSFLLHSLLGGAVTYHPIFYTLELKFLGEKVGYFLASFSW